MKFTLEGDREAHKFSLANAFKDLRYLESMANGAGLVNSVGNAVKNSYGVAIAAGGAADYVPMLPGYIDALNGGGVE
jgi:3-hydroxyisobutyrate dehydrogenase-like beta-hydroxyacid dehydrogenase